jgi:hypothetical protein
MVIIILLLTAYFAIYSSRVIFPEDAYLSKISKMYNAGIIEDKVTSRSPTGWLSDNATECLSLGVGLKNGPNFGDIFLDSYANPVNEYNPCSGLISLAENDTTDIAMSSYSRYWHGHATIIQWLTYFLGLPILKNLLWLLNLSLLILVYKKSRDISSSRRANLVIGSLLFPYVAFSDFADLQTSVTHLLSSVFILFTIFYFLKNYSKGNFRLGRIGVIFGSFYCFVLYGLSPQNIPVLILSWGSVLLIMSGINPFLVSKKIISFLYGWGLGYVTTFISKWIFVLFFTDFDIIFDVKSQLDHRTSQDVSSLSEGVAQHLDFASSFPNFIQAWVANIATLLIHVIDPRYAEGYVVIIASIAFGMLIIGSFLALVWALRVAKNGFTLIVLMNALSLIFLLGWYAILSQHSFDHATYTFRSLVIWLGGFLALGFYIFSNRTNHFFHASERNNVVH